MNTPNNKRKKESIETIEQPAVEETKEVEIQPEIIEEPVIEEPKSPVLSNDFNFSDIPDESAPEELTDVPTDEQE